MATSVNLDIAKRVDIECRKGDTFDLEFVVTGADGNALDVTTPTAFTFNMEVRETDTEPSSIIATTGEASTGFAITGDSLGVVQVTSAASMMATLSSGLYVYDLQATDQSDSSVRTWFYGVFQINEDVTV